MPLIPRKKKTFGKPGIPLLLKKPKDLVLEKNLEIVFPRNIRFTVFSQKASMINIKNLSITSMILKKLNTPTTQPRTNTGVL